MEHSFTYLIPLVSGVSTFLLGVLTLIQNRREVENRIFFIFALTLSFWLFGSALLLANCSLEAVALLIDRITYIAVIAIPPTVFHFTSTFSKIKARKYIVLGYTLMVFFWAAVASPYFVNDIYQYTYGCHAQAKVLHHFFMVFYVAYISGVFILIAKALSKTHNEKQKTQLHFVFWALLLLAIIGTGAFLPAYNINTYQLPYFAALIFALILVYGIFRHNVLGLKIVAIELFSVALVLIAIMQVLFSASRLMFYVNVVVLLLTALLAILMVRSTLNEISNREKGEKLARYLANANARLRQLDRQKTEFVSIASHQLRSPIAAIKGYTSLMLEGSFGEVPKKLDEPLSRVMESSKRISFMIDDFLNVTRIEQGRMTYNMKPEDLHAILCSVHEELRIIAEKKGLMFKLDCSQVQQIKVSADEGKLKQVFSNLVDNAIKYTEKGSVSIDLEVLPKQSVVLVKVSDTGIGVPPEEQGELFHKFNRATNANESSVYGTGLGLYIAKEIVKAHGGWIHVSSEGDKKGSVFTVELPLLQEDKYKEQVK